MRVFVLCTGRCGSTTFIRACEHISNFTAGHESKSGLLGKARLAFPDQHIEADWRLAWLTGRLAEATDGNDFFVHLHRDRDAVIESMVRKAMSRRRDPAYDGAPEIMAHRGAQVWAHLQVHALKSHELATVAGDMVDTVTANIHAFLKGRPRYAFPAVDFPLEDAANRWPSFWSYIGAEGDYDAALAEFGVKHNASEAA